MKNVTFTFLLFLTYILTSATSMAASCCGGGAALPSLITGDFASQWHLSWRNSATTHYVDENGDASERNQYYQEVQNRLNVKFNWMIDDYLQTGLGLSVVENFKKTKREENSSTGLGDFNWTFAYEALPELSYSWWQPRGYLFLQQTFPTGHSRYEGSNRSGTNHFGQGFPSTSFGLALLKSYAPFDGQWMGEVTYGWRKKHLAPGTSEEVKTYPGIGFSTLFSFGYSPWERWRVGMNVQYFYQEGAKTQGAYQSQGASLYYWDVGPNISYLMNVGGKDLSTTLQYSDQTLLGPAKNTLLSRSLTLSFIYFTAL